MFFFLGRPKYFTSLFKSDKFLDGLVIQKVLTAKFALSKKERKAIIAKIAARW